MFKRSLTRSVALVTLFLSVTAPAAAVADDAPADPTLPGPVYKTVTDKNGQLSLQTFGRPDGKDMVFRISGSVYANVEGNSLDPALRHGQKLFNIEGYNIRRLYRVPETTQLYQLSREIVFYTDPADPTRVVREWKNPIDQKTYPVIPINNDTVNFGPFNVTSSYVGPPVRQLHDESVWTSDIPVRTDFGTTLGERFGLVNGVYAAQEMFDFFVDNREVAARTGTGMVPSGAMKTKIGWARTSPWTPFMCLSETDVRGQLTYHARSWSLGSYAEIEPWLRAEVEANHPLYKSTPSAPGPSENSWTSFYNKQLGKGATTWAAWCAANGR
ncbi:Protein of unknown function [Nonomuraea solani]|uniref:DUF1838 domain-containing protein n=1 Tax=Nonomuraea solani TaxID=1144553 RepID=A0A1H6EQY2_9ACTN|nr:DUF1838 family protein [Nonomuraea solani]SEH00222.1 Protein of unknown function [Nonomuraea solani]